MARASRWHTDLPSIPHHRMLCTSASVLTGHLLRESSWLASHLHMRGEKGGGSESEKGGEREGERKGGGRKRERMGERFKGKEREGD